MISTKKTGVEKYYRWIVPYLRVMHPNVLTLLSLLPAILFFIAVLANHYFLALLCFLGSFLDVLDGLVARAYNKTSVFGAVLDSTTDRVSDFFFISAFGFAHLISWYLVLSFLLASFLVSYIRSRGELASNRKISLAIGIMERPERLIGIFIALLLFIIFPKTVFLNFNILSWGFIIFITLSVITTIQRLWYIQSNS